MNNRATMNNGATTNHGVTRNNGATRNHGEPGLNSVPDNTEGGYAIVNATKNARVVLSTNYTVHYHTEEGGYAEYATSTPVHCFQRTILSSRQQIPRSRRYRVEKSYA